MDFLPHFEGEWVSGRGYQKRRIFGADSLGIDGTLLQEVRLFKGAAVPRHYHKSCTEVFQFRSGFGAMTIDGKRYELRPGDTLICRPGQVHDAENLLDEDWLYFVLKTHVVDDDTFWAA